MPNKFERNDFEYIELDGENLELAKEYDKFLQDCFAEEKDIMDEYESRVILLRSKLSRKRKDTLMNILLSLGYDASKCDGPAFNIDTAFSDLGLAVLIRNTKLDPDEDPFENTPRTKH